MAGDAWPAELHEEAESAWRASGFKFLGEPLAVSDVAEVVAFVLACRPAVGLNVVRIQPAIEDAFKSIEGGPP